jgi:hypothetical protein
MRAPGLGGHGRCALRGGERLDVAGPGEIRKVSLSVFDRSFAVTYAFEGGLLAAFGAATGLAVGWVIG